MAGSIKCKCPKCGGKAVVSPSKGIWFYKRLKMLIIQPQVPIKSIKVALNALGFSLQRISRLKEDTPIKEMLMQHEKDAFEEISKWLETYENNDRASPAKSGGRF